MNTGSDTAGLTYGQAAPSFTTDRKSRGEPRVCTVSYSRVIRDMLQRSSDAFHERHRTVAAASYIGPVPAFSVRRVCAIHYDHLPVTRIVLTRVQHPPEV